MDHKVTIEQLLYIIPFVLSAIITLVLFSQKNINSKPRTFLLLFFAEFSIIFFISLTVKFDWTILSKVFISFLIPSFLALAPSGYLFLKNLTDPFYKISKQTFYHFIPSFITFLFYIIVTPIVYFNLISRDSELFRLMITVMGDLNYWALFYGTAVQLIIYAWLGAKILISHQKRIKNYFSDIENVKLRWIKYFLLGYIIYFATSIITDLIPFENKNISSIIYLSVSSLFILLTGYYAIKETKIYTQELEKNDSYDALSKDNEIEPSAQLSSKKEISDKESSDTFYKDEERLCALKDTIIQSIESKKMYLNTSLTIDDIAQEVNVNKKYISFVINSNLNSNFFNLINDYRVKEAIDLFSNDENHQYTLEAVGNMSGFRNRTTFLNAFKKKTGLTPSNYKKLHFKKNNQNTAKEKEVTAEQ